MTARRQATDAPTNGRRTTRDAVLVAVGLALGPAVALGLARFAYALLLPAMRDALHWSYTTAGAMNTANALGYLLGALVAAPLAHRYGARGTFLGGMAATAVALLASATTGAVGILLVLRLVAGASGAVCFVVGASLAAELGRGRSPGRAALLLGIYFGGGGLGITASGLLVTPLTAELGVATGWRWGWVVLGVAALGGLAGAAPAVRACPPPQGGPDRARWSARRFVALIGGYGLFGAGYIAYMTFVVAYLRIHGTGDAGITGFWSVLGISAVAGGFAWGPFLGRRRGGAGPATVLAVVTAGALLPLASTSTPALFGSAVLFGISFLAVVTAVTTVARSSLHPAQWTSAIAALTTSFATGQCLGPVFAGLLSDQADGVQSGMLLSAGILALGALVFLLQPPARMRK